MNGYDEFLTTPTGQIANGFLQYQSQVSTQITQFVARRKQQLSQVAANIGKVGRTTFDANMEANEAGSAAKFATDFNAEVASIKVFDPAFVVALPE